MSKIWECKIGQVDAGCLPQGSDLPMRTAVQRAFKEVTGKESNFTFSGWGAELTEPELACLENREPSEEYKTQWIANQNKDARIATLESEVAALRAQLAARDKDLRSEGRELKRLRKLVVDFVKSPTTGAANIIYTYLEHESARIQKARKAK